MPPQVRRTCRKTNVSSATPPGENGAVQTAELDPQVAARLKRDSRGLVTAVVQQEGTGEVLMVGWMDDEALHRTLTTGRSTFFSRSRNEYWVKGETSGHRQWVRGVRLDCDGDTVLVTVDQEGPACHTGSRTCFDGPTTPRSSRPSSSSRPSGIPGDHPDPGGVPARRLESRRVIPLYRRFLVDGETAIGLYQKLARNRPGSYLLESAEQGVWSRYSFIGVRAAAVLTEVDGRGLVDRPPARVPARRRRSAAGRPGHAAAAAHAAGRASAALHLGAGRLSELRRGPPGGASARRQPEGPRHPRTGLRAGVGPGGRRSSPQRGLAGGQRHQLRRLRRTGGRGVRRRRRAGRGDDPAAGRAGAVLGGRRPARPRAPGPPPAHVRRSTRRRWPRPWRRSRPARPSRSWSASASRSTPPPTHSTSTGSCG